MLFVQHFGEQYVDSEVDVFDESAWGSEPVSAFGFLFGASCSFDEGSESDIPWIYADAINDHSETDVVVRYHVSNCTGTRQGCQLDL